MSAGIPRPGNCEEHGRPLARCGPCVSLGVGQRLDAWADSLELPELLVALTCLLNDSQVYTFPEYNALLRQAIRRLSKIR